MILIPSNTRENKPWCTKLTTKERWSHLLAEASHLRKQRLSLILKTDRTISVTSPLVRGEFLVEWWVRSLGRKRRKVKAHSDDTQPLNNIQNNFLLNKRNILRRSRWKCNFRAFANGSVSDMSTFQKKWASVWLLCRQCAIPVRGCRAARALIMVSAASPHVSCKRKPLRCFAKGTHSELTERVAVKWSHCNCCIKVRTEIRVLCTRNEGVLSGLEIFLYFSKGVSNVWNLP